MMVMLDQKAIAGRLAKLRRIHLIESYGKKVTQTEMANMLDKSLSFYQMREKGKTPADEEFLLLICRTFNVSHEWLFYGKGEVFTADTERVNLFIKLFSELTKHGQEYVLSVIRNLLKSEGRAGKKKVL